MDPPARLRHAEVDDLHVAVEGDDDVGGRDVAMDDFEHPAAPVAELVSRVQAFTDVRHDARHHRQPLLRPLEPAPLNVRQDCAHGLAHEVFHRHVVGAVHLAEVEDLADVGVVDAGGDLGLVEEHVDVGLPPGQVRVHPLDGHWLLEAGSPRGPRQKDRRHTAGGDLVLQPIAPEFPLSLFDGCRRHVRFEIEPAGRDRVGGVFLGQHLGANDRRPSAAIATNADRSEADHRAGRLGVVGNAAAGRGHGDDRRRDPGQNHAADDPHPHRHAAATFFRGGAQIDGHR